MVVGTREPLAGVVLGAVDRESGRDAGAALRDTLGGELREASPPRPRAGNPITGCLPAAPRSARNRIGVFEALLSPRCGPRGPRPGREKFGRILAAGLADALLHGPCGFLRDAELGGELDRGSPLARRDHQAHRMGPLLERNV